MDQQTEVQSPFLPGTNIQFAWDSTSLGMLKRCPRLYQYTMIEGWQPKGEAIHLRFGIEYHQALHDYENCKAQGLDHEESLHQTVRAVLERSALWQKVEPRTDTERLKTRPNLVRTVIWYLEQFKDDPAKTLILENGKPAIELSFKFELDWGPSHQGLIDNTGDYIYKQPYLLCGHLDRVAEYQGHLFGMDRKTASKTPSSYYFDQYEPENQMTLYTLATKVVLDVPVSGMIIDAAQIAVNFSRFVRGMTYRTPDQLEEWVDDLKFWFAQAEHFALSDHWPMNDTACDKYGGCRFRQICNKSPSVRKNFLEASFEQVERWNPLKPR